MYTSDFLKTGTTVSLTLTYPDTEPLDLDDVELKSLDNYGVSIINRGSGNVSFFPYHRVLEIHVKKGNL